MKKRTYPHACLIPLFLICAIAAGYSPASATNPEPLYKIVIADISYEKVLKNWLLLPTSVDIKLTWAITTKDIAQNREIELQEDPQVLPFIYQVYTYHEGSSRPKIRESQKTDHTIIKQLKIGQKYDFKVRMLNARGNLMGETALSSLIVGKNGFAGRGGLRKKNWLYYAHPGRWQLAVLRKAHIYDRSTALGKVAFLFLSITSTFSIIVLVFYSTRSLYLGNVFPYKRSNKGLFWSMLLSCDASYENRLTNKFKFMLHAWEMTATKSKLVAERAVKSIPSSLSATEKMASVDVACMEYWMTDGDRAIETIEDIISYPYDNHPNGKVKSPDDLLTELVLKIEDSFHEILQDEQNGSLSNGLHEKEDMKTLIEEIYEPVTTERKPLSRLRTWVLRRGVLDLKKGLRPFPTSRIIHAGLGIHRINGYHWLKQTEDVKRAFEDRASNEIEMLKRKSKIEWFWNYGALAPLVGLFGTVTGITYAFQQLASTTGSPDFVSTIQQLSSGIFEALWTTILGLANGICFVVIYHYYKHKLDWIYSKWEELYVTITEKL